MAKQTETFRDEGPHERIYTLKEGNQTYEYGWRSTLEGLDLPNKHADTLEELQKITGMNERDVTETLIAESLEKLF